MPTNPDHPLLPPPRGPARVVQPSDYSDGRTKQSFKKSVDINFILRKAQRAGGLSHLATYQGEYGDFSDFDFLDVQVKLARAREIFDALPSELRKEFNQSPAAFFEFANDPENAGRLEELFPILAQPGRQFPAAGGQAPSEPPGAGGPPNNTPAADPSPEA